MATMRFLQANLNHCARAQDLLVQSMAQWLTHVALVAEPYHVPPRDDWVGDRDGLVALVRQTTADSPPFEKVAKGRGCVAASVGSMTVVACYCSPNRSLSDFEQFLEEVGALVRQARPAPVLVAGDFNAKSVVWGSPATDVRGEALEEWAVASGLVFVNRGSVDTCVRQRGGSIVDITMVSAALARRVQGWEVLEGVETLSDHRYIRFEILPSPAIPNSPGRAPRGANPRWALRRLNRELLVEAALVQSWLPVPQGPVDVEAEADWLGGAMSQVCDAAMPRVGPRPPKRQVYWWNAEIAQLRVACVAARRQYTRSRRRRRDEAREAELYAAYGACRRALRAAIGEAKQRAWEEMLGTLESDPWGRPYKMVRRKLRSHAAPLTQSLQPEFVEQVVAALFPDRGYFPPPSMTATISESNNEEDDDVVAGTVVPEATSAELSGAVARLSARNTAPGPDGIHGRAWVLALPEALDARLLRLFTACLERGQFPRRWKTGQLVLLKKEGRPLDSPSAYRPIVLLNEEGKLFERLLAARVVGHLEGPGPGLSENQFGFRRGRSTVDAISRVRALSQDAASGRGVVLAVSLDIANAFNSLPWTCINEALRYHRVPRYLREVIKSYLSDRSVVFPARDRWRQRVMSCGVPQGSVLGPLLWNIGYDWVLRGPLVPGVGVTCYADDTLVTARGDTYSEAALLATAGVANVVSRVRRLGLVVALEKSEALCFHGPRAAPPAGAHIVVGGVSIGVGSTMRYLGIVLDSRWNFREHFRRLAPRLIGAAGALGRLLPNLGGPSGCRRRLYAGVIRSMALYGAPIWVDALTAVNVAALRRPQRVVAVRAVRGYATVSFEAACVLAGTPPWDLEARTLAVVYRRGAELRSSGVTPQPEQIARWRRESRDDILRTWGERLEEPSAGVLTIGAIRPVLAQWVDRRHGEVTFRLTQVLSGHGCFGRYLCRVARREPTMACHSCGHPEDTAQHTLSECPGWAGPRALLVDELGVDLSLSAVIQAMVDRESAWRAMITFCETVISHKEEAERVRELDPLADPTRRRRIGRRRVAYERNLPP